ncbi:hypothetical protein HK097_003207, partial [Rhizophlyctis rosea]
MPLKNALGSSVFHGIQIAIALLTIAATYDQATVIDPATNTRKCLLNVPAMSANTEGVQLDPMGAATKREFCEVVIFGSVACTAISLILLLVNGFLYARKGRGLYWVFTSRTLTDLTLLYCLAQAILHTIGVFTTCKNLGAPLPDKIKMCKDRYGEAFGKNVETVWASVGGVWGLCLVW